MTAGQTVARRATSPTISLAPAALVGLLALALLVGGMLGAAMTSQLGRTPSPAIVPLAIQPPSAADAIKFHLEEHGVVAPAPSFDAIKFHLEEHGVVAPAPSFDAIKFHLEEHGIGVPSK